MKGFVFDLDNTLFDRYGTITKIICENFERIRPFINPAYEAEDAAKHLCAAECVYLADGPDWTRIYNTLVAEHFFNKDNIPEKQRCFDFILENFCKTSVNFPFTEALLTTLRNKGYKLGIITNGRKGIQNAKLDNLGLRPFFDAIITAGDYAEMMCGDETNRDYYKPNASIFEYMASLLGEKPQDLYYVGDNPVNDVLASQKAGYVPVWVRSRSPWPLENSLMPLTVKDVSELLYLMDDKTTSYPRLCAHRGYSAALPENSMAAFEAAISLGAEEIEFDIWETKDGVLVSTHDAELSHISDGQGLVYEHTYQELLQYDFGIKFSEEFKGTKILTLEEILKALGKKVIMNVHIKTVGQITDFSKDTLRKIIDLIYKYDCKNHAYLMCDSKVVTKLIKEMDKTVLCCQGSGFAPWEVVEDAIETGCEKLQLWKPRVNRQMIEKAHEHGIICNIFWSDEKEEAKELLDMGIDVILSNDCEEVLKTIKDRK